MKQSIDRWFYYFPVLMLFAVAAELLVARGSDPDDLFNWRFLSNVVFANSTHVGLTFGMLLTSPQMRSWIVDRFGSLRRFGWQVGGAFLAGSAVLFTLFYFSLLQKGWTVMMVYAVCHSLVALHHAFSQTTGIYAGTVYERSNNKSGFPQFSRAIKWFTILGTLVLVLGNRVQSHWDVDGASWGVFHLLLMTPVALALGLVVRARRRLDAPWTRNESLYSSRFLLWLLYPFSYFAAFAVTANHGIEYIKVSSHMISYRFRALMLAPFVVYIGFGLLNVRFGVPSLFYEPDEVGGVPWQLQLIAAIALSGTYVHYYLDRQIFRMRSAASQKNVAPLVKGLIPFESSGGAAPIDEKRLDAAI